MFRNESSQLSVIIMHTERMTMGVKGFRQIFRNDLVSDEQSQNLEAYRSEDGRKQ